MWQYGRTSGRTWATRSLTCRAPVAPPITRTSGGCASVPYPASPRRLSPASTSGRMGLPVTSARRRARAGRCPIEDSWLSSTRVAKPRQDPVGQPDRGGLLVHDQRAAQDPRRDADRHADVAARGQHPQALKSLKITKNRLLDGCCPNHNLPRHNFFSPTCFAVVRI